MLNLCVSLLHAACTLTFKNGSHIHFGDYNPFSNSVSIQSLSFVTSCANTPAEHDRKLTFSAGKQGNLTARTLMSQEGSMLSYHLLFGTGQAGSESLVVEEADDVYQTIYAQIPVHQNIMSSEYDYTDTVYVSLGSGTPQSLIMHVHVPNTCMMHVGHLNFGEYEPTGKNQTQPLKSSTRLWHACSNPAERAVTITMGNGLYAASGNRRMLGSQGGYLNYNLYLPISNQPNAACSYAQVWGGTTNLQLDLSSNVTSIQGASYNICGAIEPGQQVKAGMYHDQVQVNINY